MKRDGGLLLLLLILLFLWLLCQPAGLVPRTPPQQPQKPHPPHVQTPVPPYLSYDETQRQLAEWVTEAPGLASMGTYGKSSRGTPLAWLRVGNDYAPDRKTVLITACIHGNEPWAAGVVMGVAGKLLAGYGSDERTTRLLDNLDIYFVPVVSPDSYPHSRRVDGVDPNRDFPHPGDPNHQSTPSVLALRNLFLKVRPRAVISGHTHGRMVVVPFGDTTSPSPDDGEFQRIGRKMAQEAGYRYIRACEMYGQPIMGAELDWYYRTGSAWACVLEFGSHQERPSHEQIKSELAKTWAAFLTFLEEAPETNLHPRTWRELCPSLWPHWSWPLPFSRLASHCCTSIWCRTA